MKTAFKQAGIYVTDMKKSVEWYEKVLNLHVIRHLQDIDDWDLVFMTDEDERGELELIYVPAHKQKYDLGENVFHMGFQVPDFREALEKHRAMGLKFITLNEEKEFYFLEDPDGYQVEIYPTSFDLKGRIT